MKLRKWVKVILTIITILFTIKVYITTGYSSSNIELIKWLWIIIGEFIVYSYIWEGVKK